jgi:hypothetical protein
MKFRVYALDVWGNETDGWIVNDRHPLTTIAVPDSATDEDIWDAMVSSGVAAGPFSSVTFEEPDGDIYIDEADTGRPAFELSRV